ncbi:MAG: head decoration protein [Mesorhizobium sp.]|nr:MAG: head decoration protein [Mesorhizobium sp.]
MTSSFTEAYHTAAFILSEANGHRSRESATVASGQTLNAGEVVQFSAGKLVTADGALNTAGDVVTAVAGIVLGAVDASGGDVDNVAYIARDAEVNDNLITYPTETTLGGEKAATVESLAALGIIAR